MKQDILEGVWNKRLTTEQAYGQIDEIVKEGHEEGPVGAEYDIAADIGMDNDEYSAFLNATDLDAMARWRYEGWPTSCLICRQEIIPKQGGWVSKQINNTWGLVHFPACPVITK